MTYREMNVHSLHQVDGNKVVEERLGARKGGRVEQTGLGLQTLDGSNVAQPLGLGERAPKARFS